MRLFAFHFVEAAWQQAVQRTVIPEGGCTACASLWIAPRIHCPQKSYFPPEFPSISVTRRHPVCDVITRSPRTASGILQAVYLALSSDVGIGVRCHQVMEA